MIMSLFRRNKSEIKDTQKVFCIGLNKTGTTSVEKALIDLGYKMGDQRTGELLLEDWSKRDFSKLIELVKTADAFQDVPFSCPYTYMVLDHCFPNSKFILTIRDNPEQWYNSMTKFHAKLWGRDGQIPTVEDLKKADYIFEGYPFLFPKYCTLTPDDPYNKEILFNFYNEHTRLVNEYFRFKQDKLLVINLSDLNSYHKMCSFLGKKPLYNEFPWENKT